MGSKAVAGAVREGVKQVYWVADGAEGVRGWRVMHTPCSSLLVDLSEHSWGLIAALHAKTNRLSWQAAILICCCMYDVFVKL